MPSNQVLLIFPPFPVRHPGADHGILDTVSKDTENTAYSCIFILYLIHFQAVLSSENVSVVSKDTEDTALHVFVSYLRYI